MCEGVGRPGEKQRKITILTNTEVVEADGDSALRFLRYKNRITGEVTEYRPPEGETFGIFVFAGYEPATELVKGLAELDEHGYVITDRGQKTSVDGLYAAGDICVKNLRQVVTAVGDGAIAATELERYAAGLQKKTGLRPKQPVTRLPKVQKEQEEKEGKQQEDLFSEEMLSQLHTVFEKMAQPLVLRLALDGRPVSEELKEYMEALAGLTDKLSVEVHMEDGAEAPCVSICKQDGSETGLAFHGVPGGHEFTSFILGLYNAAGPGQAIDEDVRERIAAMETPVDMKILVSLSCTMCPELVTAAQRIAAERPSVTAEVYDLNHFPAYKDKYQVMSVPCLLINGKQPSFGKKNIRQILDLIGQS